MKDTGFLVQMHLHTAETSRCARVGGRAMARACRDAGYDLIVVTDHFFNANIACDPRLPWPQKVEILFAGYREARFEGDRIGLEVLAGWETNTFGREYLTYGLDEAFLLANPDIARVSWREYIDRVHAAGGFVAHAHPYREADYILPFEPDEYGLDAVEVLNGRHMVPRYDEKAARFAKKWKLPGIAGADAHAAIHVFDGAMRFPYPVHTAGEIFRAIARGDGEIVRDLHNR